MQKWSDIATDPAVFDPAGGNAALSFFESDRQTGDGLINLNHSVTRA